MDPNFRFREMGSNTSDHHPYPWLDRSTLNMDLPTSLPVSNKARDNITKRLDRVVARLRAASTASNPGRTLRAEIQRARAGVSWMIEQSPSQSRAALLRQLDDNVASLCVTTFTASQLQSFSEHEFAELLRTITGVIEEPQLTRIVSTVIAPRVRSMLTEKQYGLKLKEGAQPMNPK